MLQPHDLPLSEVDPAIHSLIADEGRRQAEGLELIASENFVSRAVMEAVGSVLTNKYAEGYPGRRYYGGCEVVDEVERIAIDRAKQLFGSEHANVQPHSGSQANMAAYFAVAKPGDKILAMSLAFGGHLTHGARPNFSGKLFEIVAYGLKDDETIDYDQVEALAIEHRPKVIVAGASAYPRVIDFERFRKAADAAGAVLMVDMAHVAGLVATGLHPSPIPHADIVTSTTHKTLRGPRGGLILARGELGKAIDSQIFPGIQGGPLEHVIAGKAVAFGEALKPEFATYQRRVVENAKALAKGLMEAGLRLVSGGTDNHLLLVDLRPKGTTGNVAELALGKAGITVNKNMIPHDPEKPTVTSGIRLGTPALTTRGMGPEEMAIIAGLISEVLDAPEDERKLARIRGEVLELARRFPLYGQP